VLAGSPGPAVRLGVSISAALRLVIRRAFALPVGERQNRRSLQPDVFIIGAGIVGCAVADALLAQGARVRVADVRGVAAGATQASAGMLVPFSEGHHDPVMASLGARSLALYEAFTARLTSESALLVRTGSLEVALDESEAEELRVRGAALAAEGVSCAFLTGAEARDRERQLTPDSAGALLIPAHAYTPAAELTRALWRSCEERGAEIVRSEVTALTPAAAGHIRVQLSDETVTSPIVVLAAGSWAGLIPIGLPGGVPVRPIRGQLLQLTWSDPPLSSILWGTRGYTLTWADGTMLAGATVEDVGYDDRATVAGVRDLLEGLCELVPAAWQARFTRVRVGLRPGTPDGRPIIGRSQRLPGLVYATGHYRNGVLLAPLTGELVAKAVAGEPDEAFGFTSPQRFGEY
jgi:glycine oxidase